MMNVFYFANKTLMTVCEDHLTYIFLKMDFVVIFYHFNLERYNNRQVILS